MFKCDLNDNKLPSKIYSRCNLLAVFDKVSSNKGGKTSGIDGISVKGFKEHLEEHMCQLHEELKSGNYKPQAVKLLTKYSPKDIVEISKKYISNKHK